MISLQMSLNLTDSFGLENLRYNVLGGILIIDSFNDSLCGQIKVYFKEEEKNNIYFKR